MSRIHSTCMVTCFLLVIFRNFLFNFWTYQRLITINISFENKIFFINMSKAKWTSWLSLHFFPFHLLLRGAIKSLVYDMEFIFNSCITDLRRTRAYCNAFEYVIFTLKKKQVTFIKQVFLGVITFIYAFYCHKNFSFLILKVKGICFTALLSYRFRTLRIVQIEYWITY